MTAVENIYILTISISAGVAVLAFAFGLYFGRKEGYLLGKMDGTRQSNQCIEKHFADVRNLHR